MTDHTNERQAAFGQVIQLQARNELHRHFQEPCYRPRKPTAKSVAKRVAVVLLVMLGVFVYLRFQLWVIYKL